MESLDHRMKTALDQRKALNAFRTLTFGPKGIDFSSNDYLGFVDSKAFNQVAFNNHNQSGSTGSRLLTGNSEACEALEQQIALFHKAPSGLIFNSGYDANLGLISSLAKRGDTIVYDQLVHASIREGIILSRANAYGFEHNNLLQLEKKLSKAKGQVFVLVESVYSMDGDKAPLVEILALAKKYDAALIVDEAHATGVYGPKGEGVCVELGIEDQVFARIHTFGKAIGAQGAIVLGSLTLRAYLINFCKSFIYTTALAPMSITVIQSAYSKLMNDPSLVHELQKRIEYFKTNLDGKVIRQMITSDSAIQIVLCQGNTNAKSLATKLSESGYDVRPILHPTVANGNERVRICIHLFNTYEEIKGLTMVLNNYFNQLNSDANV